MMDLAQHSHWGYDTDSINEPMKRVTMAVHSDFVHDRRVRNEAEALAEAGYIVTVLCAVHDNAMIGHKPNKLILGDVTYVLHYLKYASGKMRFVDMMRSFYKTLKQTPSDIIHAHDLDTLIPCRLASRRHHSTLIYDSHELYTESIHVGHRPFTKFIWRIIELAFIKSADAVITVCKGIADELVERYRLDKTPAVVRNFSDKPIDVLSKSVPADLISFKQYHPKLMLYQGYVQRGRGLDDAIDALATAPDWGLVICGEGPYQQKCMERALKIGVEHQIIWLGQLDLDTLYQVTRYCDLGLCMIEPISLSYYYALPNKLIEYVQAGLPVVGSDLPEIRRIMDEYAIGWVVDEHKNLHYLLKSFETLKEDKSIAMGITSASHSLNWQHEKLSLLEVYKTVINETR